MRPLFIVLLVSVCSVTSASLPNFSFSGQNPSAVQCIIRGTDLLKKGDYAGAQQLFTEAIHLDPTMYQAYAHRAIACGLGGRYQQAYDDIGQVQRLRPDFVVVRIWRAAFRHATGDYHAAKTELEELLRLPLDRHNKAFALAVRSWLKAVCPDPAYRNGKQAVEDATRACKLTNWESSGAIDTLAAAYAESGDFASAIRYEKQALEVHSKEKYYLSEVPQLRTSKEAHLAAYQAHRPWREPKT